MGEVFQTSRIVMQNQLLFITQVKTALKLLKLEFSQEISKESDFDSNAQKISKLWKGRKHQFKLGNIHSKFSFFFA